MLTFFFTNYLLLFGMLWNGCSGALAHTTGTAATVAGMRSPALPPSLRCFQHYSSLQQNPFKPNPPLRRTLKTAGLHPLHHEAKGNLTKRIFFPKANTWLVSDSVVEVSPAARTPVFLSLLFSFPSLFTKTCNSHLII